MDALGGASPGDKDTRDVAEWDDAVLVGETRGTDARDGGIQKADNVLDDAVRDDGKRCGGGNEARGGEM